MGVVQERQGNEAEFARAWVEGRARVLRATCAQLPDGGIGDDRSGGRSGMGGAVRARPGRFARESVAPLEGVAYLRALNGVRERRRHPVSSVPVEELAETGALDEDNGLRGGIEALRAEARAQEIVRQVSGDARRWIEAVFDAPSAPPRGSREDAGVGSREAEDGGAQGACSPAGVRVRASKRRDLRAPPSSHGGVRGHPSRAARSRALPRGLGEHPTSAWAYQQVALHIAGCEECERAWRNAQSRLLRPRLVFFPATLAGKLAAAGAAAIAAGRRALGAWIAWSGICGSVSGRVWAGRAPVARPAPLAPRVLWPVKAWRSAWECCARPAWARPRSSVCQRASSPRDLRPTIAGHGPPQRPRSGRVCCDGRHNHGRSIEQPGSVVGAERSIQSAQPAIAVSAPEPRPIRSAHRRTR